MTWAFEPNEFSLLGATGCTTLDAESRSFSLPPADITSGQLSLPPGGVVLNSPTYRLARAMISVHLGGRLPLRGGFTEQSRRPVSNQRTESPAMPVPIGRGPLGPFMEPTMLLTRSVPLRCRQFSIYAPQAPVVRIAINA